MEEPEMNDDEVRRRQRKAEAERDRTWDGADCENGGCVPPPSVDVADHTEQAAAHAAIGLAVELVKSGLSRREIVPILVRLRRDPLAVVLESDELEADIRIDFALARCGVAVPGMWINDEGEEVDD